MLYLFFEIAEIFILNCTVIYYVIEDNLLIIFSFFRVF